ncbi:uncharacterized protein IUM83_14073 [Phytophthora cinnamomi]|uniref:uncharacterized protein n=1 Tax=Phytophthora cinnamomi TaxID=4785 RepID=UPI0035597806|nr:hypothetical protein IUM83_14073 [Phytophthora cinnamomi]
MHWLRDCKKASEGEKAELRKDLRKAREKKRAHIKRLSQTMPVPDRRVTLNGMLVLPCCPDSGSDFTVIGRSHWEELRTLDPTMVAEQLDSAVENQTFGSSWVCANQRTRLQVMIHTAAGPVQPMGTVDVLIMDVDDDEFIVGNDLLTSLGIDVGRQLEQLADHGDDETIGDPIDLEADEMPVNMDGAEPSGDADVFAAVERIIERAVTNGFPQERVEQLRTIAHAYDVWRLELRGDPPADMPPLEIRLQDGARL